MCRNTGTDPEELRSFVALPTSPASRAVMPPSSSDPENPSRSCDGEDEMGAKDTQKLGPLLLQAFGMIAVLFFVGVAVGTYAPEVSYKTASDAVDSSPEVVATSLSEPPHHNEEQTKDEIKGLLVPFFSKPSPGRDRVVDLMMNDIIMPFLSTPSPGRDRIVELLINDYTSPLSLEKATSDRLENAIGVVEMMETDGVPVPITDHPFLFVGSIGASMNQDAVRKSGITHIINWSATARCNVHDGVEYLCFHGIRNHHQLLARVDDVDQGVEFIESARISGGRAMSHCWYGRNRSVTLLVAYLMKYEGMRMKEATRLIQRTRPQADPYIDVLEEYARRYLKEKKVGHDRGMIGHR